MQHASTAWRDVSRNSSDRVNEEDALYLIEYGGSEPEKCPPKLANPLKEFRLLAGLQCRRTYALDLTARGRGDNSPPQVNQEILRLFLGLTLYYYTHVNARAFYIPGACYHEVCDIASLPAMTILHMSYSHFMDSSAICWMDGILLT